MKYLQINWKSRVLITLVISLFISTLIVSLELTSWADQINLQGFSHGGEDKPNIPSILMYILPFVKVIVLVGATLFLTLGLMKVPALLKSVASKK